MRIYELAGCRMRDQLTRAFAAGVGRSVSIPKRIANALDEAIPAHASIGYATPVSVQNYAAAFVLTDESAWLAARDGVTHTPLSTVSAFARFETGSVNALALLPDGSPFDFFEMTPPRLNALVAELEERGIARSLVVQARGSLIGGPPGCVIEAGVDVLATFVATGVQVRKQRGDIRLFIPWSALTGLTIEGIDQVRQRPSVAATAMFGVLGLAARQTEKSAFLVLSTDAGEYVLEDKTHLPIELRTALRQFQTPQTPPASSGHDEGDSEDPIETIRRLAQLKDDGIISEGEFEETKAALLRRLRNEGP